MKNLNILVIILTLISMDVKAQINNELIGKWKWVESSGGIMGKITNPASTGTKISIEFTSEYFIKYTNDSIITEIKYKIEKGSSIRSNEESYLIVYDNGKKQSINLEGNKLILYDECHDCFQYEYVKE